MQRQIVFIALMALLSCSPKPSDDDALQQAKDIMVQGDYTEARVLLKNLINKSPMQLEARYLLGVSHFNVGDFDGALKEFKRLLEFDYAKNEVTAYILRSDLRSGRFLPVFEYIDGSSPADTGLLVQLYTMRGIELMLYGYFRAGFDSLYKALDFSSQEGEFYYSLAKAYVAGFSGQTDQAIELASNLLQQDSEFHEAALLLANLYVVAKQHDIALSHYTHYIEFQPYHFIVQAQRISQLIQSQSFDLATEHLDTLLRKSPHSYLVNELKAELEFRRGNYKPAIEYAVASLTSAPESYKANLVAGLSQYQLGNIEPAYMYLSKIENRIGKDHFVFKILLFLKFQLGFGYQAAQQIDNINLSNTFDFNLLTSASAHLLESGDQFTAKRYAEKLDQFDLESPQGLGQRGVIKLSLNDDSGLDDLHKAIKIDPDFDQARVSILFRYFEQNKLTQALEFANAWVTEKPEQEGGYLAVGLAYLQLENWQQAKRWFEQALKLNQDSTSARYNLALVHLAEQDIEKSYRLSQQILASYPTHQGALNNLLQIFAHHPEKSEVLHVLKQSMQNHPSDINVLLTYVSVLAQNEQHQEAIKTLVDNLYQHKNNEEYLLLTTKMLFGQSHFTEAEQYAQRLLALNPGKLESHLLLLLIFEAQRKFKVAHQHILQVIKTFKTEHDLKLYEITYLLHLNKMAEASLKLDRINPDNVTESLLIAVKFLRSKLQNDPLMATQYAQRLFELKPNPSNAYKYAQMLRITDQWQKSKAVLLSALDEYGDIPELLNLLGEVTIDKEPEHSVRAFQKLVDKEPSNYVYLNNLAWSQINLENFEQGLRNAERAYQLADDNPMILDTLGVANMRLGKYPKAESLLARAYQQNPNNPDVSLHYAEALMLTDKLDLSREILSNQDDSDKKQKLIEKIKIILSGS
ncbi:XrtA/PEP-CTERM system TPR-repeat protein PrsT [Thalassotalea aquiviva]|uniref:XrtA/PEP-CTERM system TPR-repeat protein PrsT n=1 Tax=Thalassotalea aquiviva TaxID=3242415 RepID=UPI00352AD5D8